MEILVAFPPLTFHVQFISKFCWPSPSNGTESKRFSQLLLGLNPHHLMMPPPLHGFASALMQTPLNVAASTSFKNPSHPGPSSFPKAPMAVISFSESSEGSRFCTPSCWDMRVSVLGFVCVKHPLTPGLLLISPLVLEYSFSDPRDSHPVHLRLCSHGSSSLSPLPKTLFKVSNLPLNPLHLPPAGAALCFVYH